MIVVDASALLEALLRTPAARAVEERLFEPQQTLHAPHLIDIEVAQVIRRSRPNTNGGQKRTLPRSWLPAMIVACPRPQCLPESQSDAWFETSPVDPTRT
jgi:predicted nucleic acid-binding protein